MISKFIKPIDDLKYLLNNIDSSNRIRESEIVGGGFLPCVCEARKIASKFKEPAITFVYRDPKPLEKIGGNNFEKKLQEDILNTFLPNLDRSQFYYLFIRHHNTDKSYELNFYMVCMTNNRQFTPYWDKRDADAHDLLMRMLHQENPLLTDPKSPEHRRLTYSSKNLTEAGKNLYKQVSDYIANMVSQKKIQSREEIIKELECRGYEIPRKGKDFFTVAKDSVRVRILGEVAKEDYGVPKNITMKNLRDEWSIINNKRAKILLRKYKHLKIYENGRNKYDENVRTSSSLLRGDYKNGLEKEGQNVAKTRNPNHGGTGAQNSSRRAQALYECYYNGAKECFGRAVAENKIGIGVQVSQANQNPRATISNLEFFLQKTSGNGREKTLLEIIMEFILCLLFPVPEIYNQRQSPYRVPPPPQPQIPKVHSSGYQTEAKEFIQQHHIKDWDYIDIIKRVFATCACKNLDPQEILKDLDISDAKSFQDSWNEYYKSHLKPQKTRQNSLFER